MISIEQRIADELKVNPHQIKTTIELLDEGATVPFIARYRKEKTGGLDDTQLRELADRLEYLRELEVRRSAVLKSIEQQEKLTPELKQSLLEADTKTRLEDHYLPYKQKRRTKAQIAKEAGLEALALQLLNDPMLVPEETAKQFINAEKNINDAKSALDGARHILIEKFAENASLLQKLRQYLQDNGMVTSRLIEDKKSEGGKYKDYFDYQESINTIPSHRALALFRGRNESILNIKLVSKQECMETLKTSPCESIIANFHEISDQGRPADKWLSQVVHWAWQIKLYSQLELELLNGLRSEAEDDAIDVFATNLKDLLMAAPAGQKTSLGLDPGIRTGVKVTLLDATGQLLEHAVIYPHQPKNDWDGSIQTLFKLCNDHQVELISIGNGTASRETEKLVMDLKKRHSELKFQHIMVSEAGASVYSASKEAAQEFPDLDVSYRGAVSIARRLQDPLAELVKIEPKAIGVGQYQHDVNQSRLNKALDSVVEDCVNAVGVDVNTASIPLLTHVSGLNQTLASNIVDYRNQNGAFKNRKELMKVARMGEKKFEQAAGFLRVNQGENPLDASSVHPESYPVVEAIAKASSKPMDQIIQNVDFIRSLSANDYINDQFGLPTVQDIFIELEKPGRDPRPEFKTATFKEGVETINDLKLNMSLEGVVTNVTKFGAFVDVGVHADGLVHISEMADKFVKSPWDVVKTGDVVKVKVIEIDLKRKRIAMTMKKKSADNTKNNTNSTPKFESQNKPKQRPQKKKNEVVINNSMADALAKAMNR